MSVQLNGRSARRRSSLFIPEENSVPQYKFSRKEDQNRSDYSQEYVDRLKSELDNWKRLYTKLQSTVLEKEAKLQSATVQDEDIFTKEQIDFLSSLTDYGQYLESVTKFNNNFEIVVEDLMEAKQELLNNREYVEELNIKMINFCRTNF